MSTKQNPPQIAQDLLDFIQRSPTPFHATGNLRQLFIDAGYSPLDESAEWQCAAGQGYVVTRNDSSIIAFRLGEDIQAGMQMLGAHTDSPCLKLKPKPDLLNQGYFQLGVEVYGGALLHPWFDRDLSIAGRVSGTNKEGELVSVLVDFESAVATVPSLAIHLNREANRNNTVNAQSDMPLVLGIGDYEFKTLLQEQCAGQLDTILDFELSCYDTQAPAFVGLNKDFIASARLDNLLSSYVAARALIDASPRRSGLFVSTDHEEVGSTSAAGAAGPFLRSVLERFCQTNSELTRFINRSNLISADNAHGIHPNYMDKHDANHGPILNAGPVIKINASQRYASTSVSSAQFQKICRERGVPVQQFVMRADMACGSTIGPITAGELGISTLDIGVPQWGMHSIRETAGSHDVAHLHSALIGCLESS